jgi:DNA-binding transcriptional regulator LsrR (DeoR family)
MPASAVSIRTVVISPSEVSQRLQTGAHPALTEIRGHCASRTDTAASIDLVGQVAAAHLEATVTLDCVLGVAGGRTMLSLARQLKPADRPGVLVLPIMGGWIGQTAICASDVAREIAERWNARANVLFAPALVKDEIARQALCVKKPLQKFCTGFQRRHGGDRHRFGDAGSERRRLCRGTGRIAARDVAELVKRGVVGETCRSSSTSRVARWMCGTSPAPLPCRGRPVKMPNVLAVGAGADKARAFLGACRMGIVKSLIVSEDLANEMQRLEALE